MLVLQVILYEKIDKYECIVIHGAEKYSGMDAVNDYTPFNFMLKYKDSSKISTQHNSKCTSFIFVNRGRKDRKINQGTLNDILRVYSGIKACEYVYGKK
jgi:hypothetical protein